jgi:hypothetical protein
MLKADMNDWIKTFLNTHIKSSARKSKASTFFLTSTKKKDIKNVKMKGITAKMEDEVQKNGKRMIYKMLGDNQLVAQRDGYCVIDYIWHELKGRTGYTKLTRPQLEREFTGIVGGHWRRHQRQPRYRVGQQIQAPDKRCLPLNPFFNCFQSHVSSRRTTSHATLCFVVNMTTATRLVATQHSKVSIAKAKRLDTAQMDDRPHRAEQQQLHSAEQRAYADSAKGTLQGEFLCLTATRRTALTTRVATWSASCRKQNTCPSTLSLPTGLR